MEGVTIFSPWPPQRFELIHAFNRIPVGLEPYIIGFESHLPRGYWAEETPLYSGMLRSLLSDRCRRIVAISEHARRVFLHTHRMHPGLSELVRKLEVRLPNIVLEDKADTMLSAPMEPLILSFVGAHFARKGGLAALRIAEIACEQHLPIRLEIISELTMGAGVWTDPVRPGALDRYLPLLDLPNVTRKATTPNREAVELLGRSHFAMLTTFGDTFGFSAIEAMAQGTPVIGTRQGALPEFIEDGVSGYLLDLDVTPRGEWLSAASPQRHTASFEAFFHDEVERLAQAALLLLKKVLADPAAYRRMRVAARASAQRFDSRPATIFWDKLYDEAVTG